MKSAKTSKTDVSALRHLIEIIGSDIYIIEVEGVFELEQKFGFRLI